MIKLRRQAVVARRSSTANRAARPQRVDFRYLSGGPISYRAGSTDIQFKCIVVSKTFPAELTRSRLVHRFPPRLVSGHDRVFLRCRYARFTNSTSSARRTCWSNPF